MQGNPSGKLSYADKISSPPSPSPVDIKQEKEKVKARHTTHNGMPYVIFKASDYYGIMDESCKFTIVGRFLRPRPQIDGIMSRFKEIVPLKGSVRIGVFDNHNVFIDLFNEKDWKTVWFRRVIEIDGMQMWLQKWSPDFKPEEDLPVAPAWVLLPGLPFYMHDWHYIKQLLSSVGTPLALDAATMGRTRPSMAKIRVKVDLLKPLPQSIFVGQEYEDSPLKGYTQKLEYEGVPKYCKHCRKIGHYMINCRALEKKKAENKEEDEEQNQEKDPQLSTGPEESNQANNSNEEVQKSLNLETIQNQQTEDAKFKNKKDSRKKTKKKKTKKMQKKKSKVLFKPANSKRKDKTDSAAKQNEFTKQSIEESILSLVTKDKTFQQDRGVEINNNEITSEENELNPGMEQQIQNSLRQISQENRIEGIENLG